MEADFDCDYNEETTALIDCRWMTGDEGCIRDDDECGYNFEKAGKECVHEPEGGESKGAYCDFLIHERCFAHRGLALNNIRRVCKAFFEQHEDFYVFNQGGWKRVDDIHKELQAILEKKTEIKSKEV